MENKRKLGEQIKYSFTIHAFRLENNGSYAENGVEKEYTKEITPFSWSQHDYQGAYEEAVNIGKTMVFFPTEQHYYGHWAE